PGDRRSGVYSEHYEGLLTEKKVCPGCIKEPKRKNYMKIFLTGGAGYIGSMAVRKLLEDGHQVTIYDSLVTGYRAAVPKGAAFIQGNLANAKEQSNFPGKRSLIGTR
ncbi:MAG: NAD-dependent epimerase/dehydratase family protein, partial [Anaerolineales bacterium]